MYFFCSGGVDCFSAERVVSLETGQCRIGSFHVPRMNARGSPEGIRLGTSSWCASMCIFSVGSPAPPRW